MCDIDQGRRLLRVVNIPSRSCKRYVMSQAIHANTVVLLALLQSPLPRLAELFTVVVNAEGALGG